MAEGTPSRPRWRRWLIAIAFAGLAAPALAEVPSPALIARLRAAESVRLEVAARFLYTPADEARTRPIPGAALPFAWTAGQMLRAAGVRVVGPEATAEAVIVVEAEARAIGRRYFAKKDDLGHVYPGASLAGEIRAVVPGLVPWRVHFAATLQPPVALAIDRGYADPANAPFAEAYAAVTSFVARLAGVIGRIWGAPALIRALDLADPLIRRYAVKALGDLGDRQAIPALVATLADGDPVLRREAAWALGKIGDPSAERALTKALTDRDADVRWFANWALARLGR